MDCLEIYETGKGRGPGRPPTATLHITEAEQATSALTLLVGSDEIGDQLREQARALAPGQRAQIDYGCWTLIYTRAQAQETAA